MLFEIILQFLHLFGNLGRTDVNREKVLVQRFDFRMRFVPFMHLSPGAGVDGLVDGINNRMAIKSLGHKVASSIRAVTFARKIITGVPHTFQDGSPFGGFERNTIGTRKASGNKSDVARECHRLPPYPIR